MPLSRLDERVLRMKELIPYIERLVAVAERWVKVQEERLELEGGRFEHAERLVAVEEHKEDRLSTPAAAASRRAGAIRASYAKRAAAKKAGG